MRAIRFVGAHRPLELQDVPDPVPQTGQVVLAVAGAGLCHSDLHIQEGALAAPAPLTLGHEIAGWVIEHGPGVNAPPVGTLVVNVGLPGGTNSADAPVRLESGFSFGPGLSFDGGLAERVALPAAWQFPVPEGVSPAQAAVSTDAVATAYHAVKVVGDVRLAQTVGIIGLGGLGMNGLHTAAMCGAQVYAADHDASKDELAKRSGAQAVYRDPDELAKHAPDVIIDFVGVESTMSAAIKSVRKGGRVVLVGLGATTLPVPTFAVTNHELTIRGAWGATRASRIEVLHFIAQGKLVPLIEEIGLDQALDGYHRLHEGKVLGRLAVVMPRPQL